jgi:nucleoside-diphosphate-sugar epimerase
MRIFVTGASGWVGSAVARELIATGHSVLGLARSDAGAAVVAAAGAEVHRGSLEDPDSLRKGAADVDGVIHTAFSHDFSKFVQNGQDEIRAIAALGDELSGSNRPLIVTSGTAMLTPGHLVTEDTPSSNGHGTVPRAPEQAAFAALPKDVRVSVVRLPPSVHGAGDHGFVAALAKTAREKGVSAYIGDGANHWPAVHRFDAAKLFCLALEKGRAGGIYQAIAEQGIVFREIADAIGRDLKLPVVSIPPETVPEHFGWFARFASINNLASSDKTQAELGWTPTQPSLIEDIVAGRYFV